MSPVFASLSNCPSSVTIVSDGSGPRSDTVASPPMPALCGYCTSSDGICVSACTTRFSPSCSICVRPTSTEGMTPLIRASLPSTVTLPIVRSFGESRGSSTTSMCVSAVTPTRTTVTGSYPRAAACSSYGPGATSTAKCPAASVSVAALRIPRSTICACAMGAPEGAWTVPLNVQHIARRTECIELRLSTLRLCRLRRLAALYRRIVAGEDLEDRAFFHRDVLAVVKVVEDADRRADGGDGQRSEITGRASARTGTFQVADVVVHHDAEFGARR